MERRRSPRFPVEFTLDFIAHLDTMGVGMASDLSKEGCTVEGNLIVHEGWNLELHLLLPDLASPLKVELAAVRGSQGRRFGVEFLRMGDEEQARLRHFVSALEAGPSRMERRAYARLPIQFPICFSGKDIVGQGMVIDLSKRGSKATVASSIQRVQPGTYLALYVFLPDQASPMKVEQAVVRWAMERAFGLEFLHMEPEEQERLRRFVSTLETGASH